MDPSPIASIENGQRLTAVDVAQALFRRQELGPVLQGPPQWPARDTAFLGSRRGGC